MMNVNKELTIDETHAKNAGIAADFIPIDVLTADYAGYRDSHNQAIGILRSTSAIISIISSSIFIWMIMRSHESLSTTQHRLLLGLCVADIIFSLGQSTFNVTAPSENDYWVWNARGNEVTCDAQGFIQVFGSSGGLYYNCALNLYFLAVVKYNKSDELIRAKIEPFLHGVPIIVALSASITLLVKKHFNDNGTGFCNAPVNMPPHCIGYDVGEVREGFEIPCGRGMEGAANVSIILNGGMFIPIVIMIVSLGMIYRAVRAQEKKLSKYGVGALRANLQQQSGSPLRQEEGMAQSSGLWGRISITLTGLSSSLRSRTWSCRKTNEAGTRSNNIQSQSRAVMHKAFGYSFAWFLSYGFVLIGVIIEVATGSSSPVFDYMTNILMPLQGLFNLLIFMHPKIMAARKPNRRGGETVSWCQAFSTAFWSKGKGGKKRASNSSNLRGRGNDRKKKTRNKDTAADKTRTPKVGRIKKKKRDKLPQEEEKCEIEVPDN